MAGGEAVGDDVVVDALGRYRTPAGWPRAAGEPLDVAHRDGCYPLFAFAAALATAPHDDHILRRTIGRIGLLDRTGVFDSDGDLHERMELTFALLMADGPPPSPGPPRDELLAALP